MFDKNGPYPPPSFHGMLVPHYIMSVDTTMDTKNIPRYAIDHRYVHNACAHTSYRYDGTLFAYLDLICDIFGRLCLTVCGHTHRTRDSIRLIPSSSSLQVDWRRQARPKITRSHRTSGPGTSDQLRIIAPALPVRVFDQSASTVPRCIYVVLPLRRSTKPMSADKGTLFNKPRICEPTRPILSYNNGLFSRGPLPLKSSPLV